MGNASCNHEEPELQPRSANHYRRQQEEAANVATNVVAEPEDTGADRLPQQNYRRQESADGRTVTTVLIMDYKQWDFENEQWKITSAVVFKYPCRRTHSK